MHDRRRNPYSLNDRVALWVTLRIGSLAFSLTTSATILLWVAWNSLGPRGLRFDVAPDFQLLLLASNFVQMTLLPLILIAQNVHDRKADSQIEMDYAQNLAMEREIMALRAAVMRMEEKIGSGQRG
jgi:uncharacterized membrane protein